MKFSQYKLLLLISLLSLSVKVYLLIQAPMVNGDAAVYVAAAQKFTQGLFSEGSQYYPMPFYPLLLTFFQKIFSDWVLAGQLLSTVALVLCIFPLYIITYKVFDYYSALSAALLFALLPCFNAAATQIIRDPIFLFLALCFLAFLASKKDLLTPFSFFFLALIAVMATLFRIEGVLLIALAPAIIVWKSRSSLTINVFIKAAISLILSVGVLIFFVWGMKHAGFETHSRLPEIIFWVENLFTLKIFGNYQELMSQLREIEPDFQGGNLSNNLIERVRHYAPFIYLLGLVEMVGKELLPGALLALWGLRWRTKIMPFSSHAVLFLPWIAFFLLNFAFCLAHNFTTSRYLWLPIVLSLPYVGNGVWLWREKFKFKPIVWGIFCGLVFLVPAVKTLSNAADNGKYAPIQQASDWLKQYDPKKSLRILFNDSRLALYSDRLDEQWRGNVQDLLFSSEENYDLAVLVLHKDYKDLSFQKNFVELAVFKGEIYSVLVVEKLE